MKKNLSFFFIGLFVLFSSCAVKVHLDSENKNYTLKGSNFYIDDLEIIPWKVGQNYETTITKGFMITVYYPKLTEDIIKKLIEKGADSWILEYVRITPSGGNETIGYINVPFFRSISDHYIPFVTSTHNKLFIKMIYAAASPSKRFEEFECPAFGHDRKITDYSFDSLDPIDSISVFPRNKIDAPYKELASGGFQAIEFNGGTIFRGKYFLRFALFNSQNKTYYSDVQETDNILNIDNEERISIPGCRGNEPIPPKPEDGADSYKRFKFGN